MNEAMSPIHIIITVLTILAVCNPRKSLVLCKPMIQTYGTIIKNLQNVFDALTTACKLRINRTQDGDIATNIKCGNLLQSQCKCSGDTPYLHLHKNYRSCLAEYYGETKVNHDNINTDDSAQLKLNNKRQTLTHVDVLDYNFKCWNTTVWWNTKKDILLYFRQFLKYKGNDVFLTSLDRFKGLVVRTKFGSNAKWNVLRFLGEVKYPLNPTMFKVEPKKSDSLETNSFSAASKTRVPPTTALLSTTESLTRSITNRLKTYSNCNSTIGSLSGANTTTPTIIAVEIYLDIKFVPDSANDNTIILTNQSINATMDTMDTKAVALTMILFNVISFIVAHTLPAIFCWRSEINKKSKKICPLHKIDTAHDSDIYCEVKDNLKNPEKVGRKENPENQVEIPLNQIKRKCYNKKTALCDSYEDLDEHYHRCLESPEHPEKLENPEDSKNHNENDLGRKYAEFHHENKIDNEQPDIYELVDDNEHIYNENFKSYTPLNINKENIVEPYKKINKTTTSNDQFSSTNASESNYYSTAIGHISKKPDAINSLYAKIDKRRNAVKKRLTGKVQSYNIRLSSNNEVEAVNIQKNDEINYYSSVISCDEATDNNISDVYAEVDKKHKSAIMDPNDETFADVNNIIQDNKVVESPKDPTTIKINTIKHIKETSNDIYTPINNDQEHVQTYSELNHYTFGEQGEENHYHEVEPSYYSTAPNNGGLTGDKVEASYYSTVPSNDNMTGDKAEASYYSTASSNDVLTGDKAEASYYSTSSSNEKDEDPFSQLYAKVNKPNKLIEVMKSDIDAECDNSHESNLSKQPFCNSKGKVEGQQIDDCYSYVDDIDEMKVDTRKEDSYSYVDDIEIKLDTRKEDCYSYVDDIEIKLDKAVGKIEKKKRNVLQKIRQKRKK